MNDAPDGAPAAGHSVPHAPQFDTAASILGLLADPTRLSILYTLTGGPTDVSDLTDAVDSSRTSVSQHLAKLRLAGLVTSTKNGRHVVYRLAGGHLERLVHEALRHADHEVQGTPHHD